MNATLPPRPAISTTALACALMLATFASAVAESGERAMATEKRKPFPIYESPRGAATRVVRVPSVTPDKLDRGAPTESPRMSANRIIRVPGVTPDLLVREAPSESPRMSANRVRRVPGVTPDRVNRGIASEAPAPSPDRSGAGTNRAARDSAISKPAS